LSKSPSSSIPKLFHGTPSDISQSLELPQEESHPGSGRVIFATPDIMCAIAYSLKAARGRDDKAQMGGLRIYTGEKNHRLQYFELQKEISKKSLKILVVDFCSK